MEFDRLQLERMIQANNVEDMTNDIRQKKHSMKIRDDVEKMIKLKKTYARIRKTHPEQFETMLIHQCSFLFNSYTDIFNKLKKDELDVPLFYRLLYVLKQIEDGVYDQHEGAFQVGKLLKAIYIDSALKRTEKQEQKEERNHKKNKRSSSSTSSNAPQIHTTTSTNAHKSLTWAEYKQSQLDQSNTNTKTQ
jgi:hypothetical protein